MVEAILAGSSAEPSIARQSIARQGYAAAAAPVTLSVVIPMLDEAAGIDRLFAALEASLALAGCSYEIVCINDGSRDETLARLLAHRDRNPAIKIVSLSRNFG